MKYAIYHNHYSQSLNLVNEIKSFLAKKQFIEDDQAPEIIICVGGDGTFLRSFQKHYTQNPEVVFLPINSGSIGFFSYCKIDNWKTMLEQLFTNNWKNNIFQQPLLVVTNAQKTIYALNEIRLIDNSNTISGDVFINDSLFEFFRGSGLVFVSSLGSTGYSKSIGGAIMLHDTAAFQMLEIAPIANNKHRSIDAPVIMPLNYQVTFKPKWLNDANLVVDGIKVAFDKKQLLKFATSEQTLKIFSNLKDNQKRYLSEKLIFNLERESKINE